jgi:signal transduction histidine kinase
VSNTQIIIVLAVAASVLVIFGCLIMVVVIRLRRMVNTQLKTLNDLLSAQRADRGPDTPREPS